MVKFKLKIIEVFFHEMTLQNYSFLTIINCEAYMLFLSELESFCISYFQIKNGMYSKRTL